MNKMKHPTLKECEHLHEQRYLSKSEKGDLVLYTYADKCTWEKYWNHVTINCRGLIFDKCSENIVAKPFPKFFNLGENEIYLSNIPKTPYVVEEKMDGSLGIIYHYNGEWCVATKGSLNSPQALEAEKIIEEKYNLSSINTDLTLLVEIIYPSNRVIVNYGDRRELVLLAAYNRRTLEEEDRWILSNIEIDTHIPLNNTYNHSVEDIVEHKKNLSKNEEGYVIRFECGFRVKIKGDEYLKLHKIKSFLSPLSLWEIMKNGRVDRKFLEELPDEFHQEARSIYIILESKYQKVFNEIVTLANNLPFSFSLTTEGKKELGLYIKDKSDIHKLLFPYFLKDEGKIDNYIMKAIRPTANNMED